ncbi:hypothetical protein H5410_054111 [Solanum commersonii]|uniref:DUF4220 domain-containing protein n=1 Tax=Solanum commersonii TaxID=4109 RepID=A0A9J5X8B8_SOLCO|nr:hypothetical protein H5410_054111 [Solanum commersonii]
MNFNLKKIWDAWDIRAVILFSLTLQIILIFFAPLRKRVSTVYLTLPLWSGYLLVEWAANFAVGHISDSKGDDDRFAAENKVQDVLVFWAPFLLVHLGGPDTISAFALEDNALWHRHFLGLVTQGSSVAYVFFRTVSKNKLLIPTVLIFVVGVIKYGERIRALYLASLDRFRESIMKDPDPGPNYAKLMDEYSSKQAANLPTNIEMIHEFYGDLEEEKSVKKGLSDLEVVEEAHYFFEKFKGLIVDLIFDFRQRNESRNFFLSLKAIDAFRVIEVELNFIYDVLFTKMIVANSYWGYVLRFICFPLEIAAAILFYRWDKRGLPRWEIGVSYTLLLGALILDFTSFFMLLFSDWTTVALKKKGYVLWRLRKPDCGWLNRRWAESIAQFNLINYCVRGCSKRKESIYQWFGIVDVLNRVMYVKCEKFTDQMRDFIYEEIKNKSSLAEDLETAKEIWLAKGDWTLRANSSTHLLPYITESNFDEVLLVWHIATELCYSKDNIVIDGDKPTSSPVNYREISKILSDYMLYLLVMQPSMMSAVAGIGQIRYRDTCAEAEKFFLSRNIMKSTTNKDNQGYNNFFTCSCLKRTTNDEEGEQVHKRREEKHVRACKAILEVNAVVKPVQVKGDRSKSALFDGRRLAKELEELDHGIDKWELISKVWVEMLSHAAINCNPNEHCQQLSKGGQLITLVWLLMTHFGLGNNFQISEGHARAKLIVGK